MPLRTQYINAYPFGSVLGGRNGNTSVYRYSFQNQETDAEVKGAGNSVNFEYRMHDPRLGRFLSIDPLAPKYPHNSPYAFSENRVIDAIELEGLEAFFIHGTNSSPNRWTENPKTIPIIMELSSSITYDAGFDWTDLDGTGNDPRHRLEAAERLADYVIANRVKGDDITLIGHSHGGNVAIQASEIIHARTGEKVNLITIATPAYNTGGYNFTEDPADYQNSISSHLHIYNSIDGIQTSGASTMGPLPSERKYKNGFTQNVEINVSNKYRWWEWIDAHSFDVMFPETIKKSNIEPQEPVKNE